MATRRPALLVAFVCALLCLRCTSSTTSTSLVAPSGDKCQVSAATSAGSFNANGGSGTLTINAARDCTWSVSADAGWIAIAGPASGQGEASVPYAVQANPTPAARTGALVIASDRLTIAQSGAPCRFDLSRSADSIAASGGRLSVGVTTLTGCAWKATSGASWISIASGGSGSATGTVVLSIAANSGDARVGQVNVAGQNYSVSQEGAVPAPTPPPDPPPPSPTPPPPSPPPPPPGPTVQFDGTIANLAGGCPDVTFSVRGVLVIADSSTDYKHGRCGDLRNDNNVSVTGVLLRAATVQATGLDLKNKGGGNDH